MLFEDSPDSFLSALLHDGHSLRLAGQWPSAIASYESLISTAVSCGNVDVVLEAYLAIGHALREAGQLADAEEMYRLTLVVADLHEAIGIRSRGLNGLAIVRQEFGDAAAAADLYAQAGALADVIGDRLGQGNIHQNLGTLACIQGKFQEANHHFKSAVRYFEAVGNTRGLAGVFNNLGMLYVDTGDLVRASGCYCEALQLAQDAGDLPAQGAIYVNLAELHIDRGEYDIAHSYCDEATEIAAATSDDRIRADALRLSGVAVRASGKFSLSRNLLGQAIRVARGRGNLLTVAEALREQAVTLRLLRRNKEALESLYESYALFQKLKAVPEQKAVDRQVIKLHEDFLLVVAAWGESIEAKDPYTSGHCHRVADYACRLAAEVGIPDREVIWFRMGALLHDVGKTEIPDALLQKSGSLSIDERKLMESHTIRGVQLLSHIDFPWDIRPMIRSHHERWDGNGYPDRLSGEEIPLSARILSCADVFDALTTHRSYRAAMSAADAIRVMASDRGALDPNLLSAFQRVIQDLTTECDPPAVCVASA